MYYSMYMYYSKGNYVIYNKKKKEKERERGKKKWEHLQTFMDIYIWLITLVIK